MPTFISQGRYTHGAIKGMVAAPEDREQAVRQLFESAGGKLLSIYMTFGVNDWLVIADMPDEQSMLAAMAAVVAGGGVTDTTTVLAVKPAEFKKACEQGSKLTSTFKSAGQHR
ncbi:MAG: GYD domain-containing protein [Bradyrhizobium sp.]|nr:GYD domain-containing protein [Bradyrhizobium sp.]